MPNASEPEPDHSWAGDDESQSRRQDALAALAKSSNLMSIGIVADVEGGLILLSAWQSYLKGVDVAAVITAHASSERDLLTRAAHWAEAGDRKPPKGFEMWGLGKLLQHYQSQLPTNLQSDLNELNARRRTLYHYGHSDTRTGVDPSTYAFIDSHGTTHIVDDYKRRYGRLPDPKETLEHATKMMLRGWALDALSTAIAVRAWANS
jgi:hypothetical protein